MTYLSRSSLILLIDSSSMAMPSLAMFWLVLSIAIFIFAKRILLSMWGPAVAENKFHVFGVRTLAIVNIVATIRELWYAVAK